MQSFLTLKHWHLFLLICICGVWTSPSPLKEIINSISIITLLIWMYTIGVEGAKRISELGLQQMNIRLFKLNLLFIALFTAIVFIFLNDNEPTHTDSFQLMDIPLLVGSLYFLFAVFYLIIFISKVITKVELKKEVSFSDYTNNLFFLLFFFIGVWYLQPKIKKYFVKTEKDSI